VTRIVSPATAGVLIAKAAKRASPPIPTCTAGPLLQGLGDMLGMLLVALKNLEPGGEEIL
jgi:hypothetical protein